MNERIELIEKAGISLLRLIKDFETTKCASHDFLRRALVLFLQRFLTHFNSVKLLNEGRDHLLIARSAIEGGVILKWILQPKKLSEKGLRARKYIEMKNVVAMEKTNALGDKISPEVKRAVKKALLSTEVALSPEEYNDVSIDRPLTFIVFLKRLTDGMTIGDIIKDDNSLDNDIYFKSYNFMSAFHHWNAFYMFVRFNDDGAVIYGDTDLEKEYELSLMSSIIILAETASQLSQIAGLRKEIQIERLITKLDNSLKAMKQQK